MLYRYLRFYYLPFDTTVLWYLLNATFDLWIGPAESHNVCHNLSDGFSCLEDVRQV
jgi:hypothetical protein